MGANPHANGGSLLRDLRDAGFPRLRGERAHARRGGGRGDRACGRVPARRDEAQRRARNFRVFGPDETASNRWTPCSKSPIANSMARNPCPPTITCPPDGRVMEMLSEHHVPGLAGRLPAHRPARVLLLLRGVHPHHRFDVQPARQVAQDMPAHPVAAAHRLAELPAHLATSGGRTTTGSATRTPASSTTW